MKIDKQLRWELLEDARQAGDWRVEAIGSEGECFVTIFSGPNAKARADEYVFMMNS